VIPGDITTLAKNKPLFGRKYPQGSEKYGKWLKRKTSDLNIIVPI
jgi:hypothetical protein